MMEKPASFIIQELVSPTIYTARRERAWELIDPRAIITLQQVRDHFGPTTVNNWHAGGTYKESGLRAVTSGTGAAYSQHRYGRAMDCKIQGVTPQEAHDYILAHPEKFPHLTVLENPEATPTWLHFDVRFHTRGGVWVVNP
jgi:hypothetical protein